ncbi:MAG: hypothetical protein R3Y64_10040 [Peptostreptococcaceae bacterium]
MLLIKRAFAGKGDPAVKSATKSRIKRVKNTGRGNTVASGNKLSQAETNFWG